MSNSGTTVPSELSKKRKSSKVNTAESPKVSKRPKRLKKTPVVTPVTTAAPLRVTPTTLSSGRSRRRAPSSASVLGEAPDPGDPGVTEDPGIAEVAAVFRDTLRQSLLTSSQGTLGIHSQAPLQAVSDIHSVQPGRVSASQPDRIPASQPILSSDISTVPDLEPGPFEQSEEEDMFSGFSVSPPYEAKDDMIQFKDEMREQQRQALRDQHSVFLDFQSRLCQQINDIVRPQPAPQQVPFLQPPQVPAQSRPPRALPAVQVPPVVTPPAAHYPAIEYPGWEGDGYVYDDCDEYDYGDYGEEEDDLTEYYPDPEESPESYFPPNNSDLFTIAEIRATLEVLRDSLGLEVTTTETDQRVSRSLTTASSFISPANVFSCPVDPEVVMRAEALASGVLRPKPPGVPLTVLASETAPIARSTPIPTDVWDRLIALKKAKVTPAASGSHRPASNKGTLTDKATAEVENNLTWMGEAAKYGIEASNLMLYVVEWLIRVEKGLLPPPSDQERLMMLTSLSKLLRRSLDQHLRVSLRAIHLRRSHILPLCVVPEIALERFQTLTLIGDDLFAGAFQQTIASEAERRDAFQKTTFSEGLSSGRSGRPFRGHPRSRGGRATFSAGSRASGTRGRGRYQRRAYQPRSYSRRSYGARRTAGRTTRSNQPFRRSGRGGRQ